MSGGDLVSLSSRGGVCGSATDGLPEGAAAGVVVAQALGAAVEVEDDGAVQQPVARVQPSASSPHLEP